MNPIMRLVRAGIGYSHRDLFGDVKDYRTVHINGVPASSIQEIKDAVPHAHAIAVERMEDCGIWVDPLVTTNFSGKPVIIPVILPEEFGTPSRTAGFVQVYSTADGWL